MRKNLLGIGVLVIGVIVIGSYWARKPLLARYYAWGMERAVEESEVNYEGIASLEDAAVPSLLRALCQEQAAQDRAAKALTMIVERLPEDDPRHSKIAKQLTTSFSGFSSHGRFVVLVLVLDPLLERCPACRDSCREIVKTSLKDEDVRNRTIAIMLAQRRDMALGPDVVPLLADAHAEVRRAAMLAVGTSLELIGTDDLLRWLHDPDKTVCDLCEAALKFRGLRDKDLRMGRLVTDTSFLKRLEVIDYLPNDDQIDPQAWLQRLSQDPVPAVRAAAARAGMDPDWQLHVDFRERVLEMANTDPDGTVRQIADHLLNGQKRY